MKKILTILSFLTFNACIAQNVGINTTAPTEALDVNGNINVDGTLKVNGAAGTTGQVLTRNSSNGMQWSTISGYKNTVGFNPTSLTTNTTYNWMVPAGVTRLLVEAWGSGGGGAIGGGGGGGAYVATEWAVTPGSTVNIEIGIGGVGATGVSGSGGAGKSTTIKINTVELIALGGTEAAPTNRGAGGDFGSASPALMYWGYSGESGESTKKTFGQFGSGPNDFFEATNYGSGGAAGNTPNIINNGGSRTVGRNTGEVFLNVSSENGPRPGGGGGGEYNGGSDGYPGMAIIHY